jgi:hypothetical protein
LKPGSGMVTILFVLLAFLVCGYSTTLAQEQDAPLRESTADSLVAAADTTAAAGEPGAGTEDMTTLERLQAMAGDPSQASQIEVVQEPFFKELSNAPKGGAKANVRQYTYFGDLVTVLKFKKNSTFRNTFKWSWEEYRKQEKTVQRRDNNFSFGLGNNLPVTTSVDGSWNWSEDRTTNTAGYANLSKRNQKRAGLNAMKSNFATGVLNHTAKMSARMMDQQSINQSQRNDFEEAALDGGLQTDMGIAEGVRIAGRVYGMALEGDRLLGQTTESSSANGDTLGLGVYYKKSLADGRVAITRSSFEKKYLDFKKNSNGLIDTVGVAEDEKVVRESETTDAISYELDNNFRIGRFGVRTRLTRQTDDHDYALSGVGLKQREQDVMDLALTFGAGQDSFAVSYDYLWKWDDQRYKGATENRGRQYHKSRDYELIYYRDLFRRTKLNLRYHEGLSQDIAENQHNQNDKDRHQSDLSAKLDRTWVGKFRTTMVFAFQQIQDFNIRESRSSNNNVKESYELSPGYGWTISRWLSLDQSYRVYIQYTNYSFSGEDSGNRSDDYNKRGNLATKVNIDPTRRLNITLRHDFNKRFSATKTGTDAAGTVFYHRDLNQTISKIELTMRFMAVQGVTLEASTYRTRDDRETFGSRASETRNFSGEMWAGANVRHKWGKKNPLELSAMVRKYNAFGPSVTETSSDYWEADIWLSWEF